LAIVVLLIVVVFVAFASLVAWSFSRVGRWLVADSARHQELYGQVTAWLEGHGIAVAGLWAEHFNMRWLIGVVQRITGHVHTTIGFWLDVLVYVILGLLEVDDMVRKLQSMPNRGAAELLLNGSSATAAKFRSYLLIRTLMSMATGGLVWAFATLAGLQLAAEWGVIAFALNYSIGPFIATALSRPCCMAQLRRQDTLVSYLLERHPVNRGSCHQPRLSLQLLLSPIHCNSSLFLLDILSLGPSSGCQMSTTFCAQHPSRLAGPFSGPRRGAIKRPDGNKPCFLSFGAKRHSLPSGQRPACESGNWLASRQLSP
jgi:hypothetical protein